MTIRDFPRERPHQIVCGRNVFPLLFATFTRLQPVVDSTGTLAILRVGYFFTAKEQEGEI